MGLLTAGPALERVGEKLGSDFDRTFSLCAREVLGSLLGRKACSLLLQYVESRHWLSIEELGSHFDEFSEALLEMFGSGAEVIEAEILKDLERRVKEMSPER